MKENAFIRMGYADINGNARMVDMEGNVQEVNLKGMDFFERALQVEKAYPTHLRTNRMPADI